MSVDIPFDSMSFAERLHVLEMAWDSLRRKPDELPSPEWHKDLLEERRRRIESGETTISSWDEAKKRLDQLGQ